MSGFVDRILYGIKVPFVRFNYWRVRRMLRRKCKQHRKLKVVFLVSEIAKWKGQSLYDRMCNSKMFYPVIAVMNLTRLAALPLDKQIQIGRENFKYFQNRGMNVIDIQRYGTKFTKNIYKIGADIVFYQQPWDLPRQMKPVIVSTRALTYYYPYGLPDSGNPSLRVGHKLHHLVQGHIVLNEEVLRFCDNAMKHFPGAYAARLLPLGHPMLDAIKFDNYNDKNGYVIYAPHWSIEFGSCIPPVRYATFDWNGKAILEYAKSHSKIKWVFKPHPALRSILITSGFMTESQVNEYYKAWEHIGESCYTSEYSDIFSQSYALITDCGSFLVEYACTGKPIIRLSGPKVNTTPLPMMCNLFATYYGVSNLEEMKEIFDEVLVRRIDTKRQLRLNELNKLNLLGHNASKKIIEYLENELKGTLICKD